MTATALIGLLWMRRSPAKTINIGGRQGLRPWPLRCLSQFLFERKERLLRGGGGGGGGGGGNMSCVEMCIRIGVPFSDGAALYL